jgi:hypothetical protein
MRGFKKKLRARGVYLTAEQALIIRNAVLRARVSVTEPGSDVLVDFVRRCEELEGS